METRQQKHKNRSSKPDIDPLIYGRVPPNNIEAEKAVLGALMMEADGYDTASSIIGPECFYTDAHQKIFKAIRSLKEKSQPVDMLTVLNQLKCSEEIDVIGGPYYLTTLTNAVVSGAHVEVHARIIFENYLLREQIRICGEGLARAFEDSTDAFDSLDKLQGDIVDLAVSNATAVKPITNILVERYQRLQELRKRDDHLTGIPTGFAPLDLLTAGWQDTDLIIIAARPSVGKTAFALNLAKNAVSHKTKPTPVAIFSLEMSGGQLTDRLMSMESGVDLDRIVRAKLSDEMMEVLYSNGVQKIAGYPLFIDDTPALTIYDLKTRCRKLKKSEKIGLVIIDYLQLMSGTDGKQLGKTGNREQEIANISRNLKALAKELKIPVIALSQLSREIERRKGDPQLSDLRESGAIEQDADMVMFLTRPDYQVDETDPQIQDCADIHIKKHRNGSLARITMRTVLNIQRWMTNSEYDIYKRNTEGVFSNWKRLPANYMEPEKDEGDPF
jgi:replicative DNA helicase